MSIARYIHGNKPFQESLGYLKLNSLWVSELKTEANYLNIDADIISTTDNVIEGFNHVGTDAIYNKAGQHILDVADLREVSMRKNNQVVDLNLLDTDSVAVWADADRADKNDEAWYYDSSNNNKINWYFYGDLSNNMAVEYQQLQMAYAVVDVPAGKKPFWWTAYSHIIDASATFYQTRWNYTGYYHLADDGMVRDQKMVLYINPKQDNKEPAEIFPHLTGLPVYNLGSEAIDVDGTGDPEETILFLAINTNSADRDHEFTLYESGVKMDGLKGKIYRTIA